ncbi:MAG TPA: hypothetical protein VKU41_07480 [Polyangiaceae bacterium]|nr:hypothetical protein [Polyangiaceae bacterium]
MGPHRLQGMRAILAFLGVALLRCSSDAHGLAVHAADGAGCFPDADGLTGGAYTIDVAVDDHGFSKTVINTQNDATVTLTLTNKGSRPHGFEVGCTSVTAAYPDLPASCPTMTCFPAASTIGALAPGDSKTVTFFTPQVDNVIYPFQSTEQDDSSVSGLNGGQWSVM